MLTTHAYTAKSATTNRLNKARARADEIVKQLAANPAFIANVRADREDLNPRDSALFPTCTMTCQLTCNNVTCQVTGMIGV